MQWAQEERAPLDDFTVWLEVKKLIKQDYPEGEVMLKEDDEDNVSVIFAEESLKDNREFENFVLNLLKERFGAGIVAKTSFCAVSREQFKVVY